MGAGDAAIYTRHTATIGGFQVPYLKGGAQRDVSPVLYLHGFGGGGKWEALHMAMGTVTLVVTPALPGWQQGAPPDGISRVQDYAQVVAELLDTLAVGPVILAGHSIGGWIAQHVAVQWPERIAQLVLIDPLGLDVPDTPAPDLGTLTEEEFATRTFGKLGMVATANPYGFGAEWQAVHSGPEFERQWKGSRLVAGLARGAWSDPDLTARVRALRVPTLLLWGRLDGLAPVRQGELLHQWLLGSELRIIERAGHLPMVERPETVNRLVRDFLLGVQENIPDVTSSK